MKHIIAIVVTYNGSHCVERCISSLLADSTISQVYVIDNNSSDNTTEILAKFHESIKLICLPQNLGFGRANNIGILLGIKADATHFLLVNQDAYILQNCVLQLIASCDHLENPGILSPLHIASEGARLDLRFANHISRCSDRDSLLSDLLLHGNNIKESYNTEFINAAIWLIPKESIEQVGLFSPAFFHYGEDEDFCIRVLRAKRSICVVPKALAIHDRPQCVKSETQQKKLYMMRAFLTLSIASVDHPNVAGISKYILSLLLYLPPFFSDSLSFRLVKLRALIIVLQRLPIIMFWRRSAFEDISLFFEHAERLTDRYLSSEISSK